MFTRSYAVHKIQKGKYLQHATEKSIDAFMECRLHNRPRKAMVGLWLVLYEDENYVYWGKPRFRCLFSDKRVVEVLFKTNKEAVLATYPEYRKDFFSLDLKRKVLEAIRKYMGELDGILFHHATFDKELEISIEKDSFVIKAACTVNSTSAPYSGREGEVKTPTNRSQTFTVVLNREDLELIKVEG